MKSSKSRRSFHLALGLSAVLMAALPGCYGHEGSPDQDQSDAIEASADGAADIPVRPDFVAPFTADGEEFVGGEMVAEINIGGGSKVLFIGLGKDEVKEVAVVAGVMPGTLDPLSQPELEAASPLEIWNAISEPGTPVPEAMAQLYGVEAEIGPQGWMREGIELVASGKASMQTTGACDNTAFMSGVRSYGYNDFELFRLDQEPGPDADGVWTYYSDCFGTSFQGGCPTFYRYTATRLDADEFYGRVAVCDLDDHPELSGNWGSWSHPGPTIQFWFRLPGEQYYDLSFQKDVEAHQVGMYWHWHGASSVDTDRQIVVKEAEAYDAFDIGLAHEF